MQVQATLEEWFAHTGGEGCLEAVSSLQGEGTSCPEITWDHSGESGRDDKRGMQSVCRRCQSVCLSQALTCTSEDSGDKWELKSSVLGTQGS